MNLTEISSETRIDHQEWLILQVSLHIEKLMQQKNISRAELARRLGVNRAYVTQLLDGANLSLRKVADVLMALDASLTVDTAPAGFHTSVLPESNTGSMGTISHWGMAIAKDRSNANYQQQAIVYNHPPKNELFEKAKDLDNAA